MIVAPVRRRSSSGSGPPTQLAPIVIRPGQQVDDGALLADLVARGYRREHQVEHRGEFAVRGGIVDVFPSTADAPVRIDLWGDEVDRLTVFAVSDQRSLHDLGAVARSSAAASSSPPPRSRPRRSRSWRGDHGGRRCGSAWRDGEQFDGMESWLPFLERTERVLPDLLGAGSQVVLAEPRRIRDRGTQLLDEEAALAETLAATWGAKEAEEGSFPRLHVNFDRLLRDCDAGCGRAAQRARRAVHQLRSPCGASTRSRGIRAAWRPG